VDVDLQTLVGRNIRRFRLADRLTIEELAFRAQLHPNYLGDVERGRRNPALGNLKKIADGLKKPLTDLLSGARGSAASTPTPARGRTAIYFSAGQEQDLLSLIKSLRKRSPKDRERIIQIAKSLCAKLRNG
jgi:transcriptional regulator with XRE-family HTH domain